MPEEEHQTTLSRLEKLIRKNYTLPPDALKPTATLAELGIDSMSTIDLLFNVEDEFGITIGREQVELQTVQDVVDYIDKLVMEQCGNTVGESAA